MSSSWSPGGTLCQGDISGQVEALYVESSPYPLGTINVCPTVAETFQPELKRRADTQDVCDPIPVF